MGAFFPRARRGSLKTQHVLFLLLWRLCLAYNAYNYVTCPPGYVKVQNKCFGVSSTEHTFESCQRDVCGKVGGTLACVHGKEVWVASRLGVGRTEDLFAVWIGFSDASGSWEWINGCRNNFTNWVEGEPNNYCGGEDCAAIAGADGGFVDVSCRLRLPCLCEYPAKLTKQFNYSVATMRDDTCYANCGDVTKWCAAWPFLRLYDDDDDVCHWEDKDGQKRGRGASDCAERVQKHPECGKYFSYAVGHCRCSPKKGDHSQCKNRQKDARYDVFKIGSADQGARIVHSRQKCVYGTPIDDAHFKDIRPNTKGMAFWKVWWRAAFIWISFGVPCGLVMFVIISRMCFCCAKGNGEQDLGQSNSEGANHAYGCLIEVDGAADVDPGEVVNRWIYRGATGIIVYGFANLGLGFSLALHMTGARFSFAGDLLMALLMFGSMSITTRASCMIHRRLAPIAREVAGPWVLVVALAKLGMALTALGNVFVFSTLAHQDYDNICFAVYLFRWSLLVLLPLYTLANFAISRVQVRAERYAGERARVGGYVCLLVCGNCSSGAAIWWAGYLDCVHEAGMLVAFCFLVAAAGQLLAGLSLMLANWKVKQYFKTATNTQADAPPTTIGVSIDDSATGA